MDTIDCLKERLVNAKIDGLALDIDETLSLTAHYWIGKMQILFGNPEGLQTAEIIEKYRYVQNIPYWQTRRINKWVNEQIKSNDLILEYPLVENSNEFVWKINDVVPVLLYLTARPESVLFGTKAWLQKHNFPETDIITRPDHISKEAGSKWKAEVLTKLYPHIKGIVDDNPSLVMNLTSDYQGTIFLFGQSEIPRKDLNIIPCKKWPDVYQAVVASL